MSDICRRSDLHVLGALGKASWSRLVESSTVLPESYCELGGDEFLDRFREL